MSLQLAPNPLIALPVLRTGISEAAPLTEGGPRFLRQSLETIG